MGRSGPGPGEWSALAGEMVGGAASVPVPGVGFGKAAGQTGWQAFKQFAKGIAGEAGIGATTAGIDFVPEGLSREENILFGLI